MNSISASPQMPSNRESDLAKLYQTFQRRRQTLEPTSKDLADKSSTYTPKSLTIPLGVLVCTLCLMTIAEITILVLAGFDAIGFSLHEGVLIAIASGLSLQFGAALLSPFANNITKIVLAQIKKS